MSKARIMPVSSFFNKTFRGGINSLCKVGYKGRMCNECELNASDGKIYGRSGSSTCSACH